MIRVLVVGRRGQLARCLAERAAAFRDIDLVCLGRPDIDLLAPEQIEQHIRGAAPDVVICAAAYTDVDGAESEPDRAHAINAVGAGVVALAAREAGAVVVHVSTDYVFSGAKQTAYVESDATGPINVYGASKLAGELAVIAANPRHVIVRTAWVVSPFGRNFARSILRLAEERDRIAVVADQFGNPTSALELAQGLLVAVRQWPELVPGVYHLAGRGETHWAGLAEVILAESARQGGPRAVIEPIPASAFPRPATRPANSRLSSAHFAETFGWEMPDWHAGVAEVTRRLVGETV